jgi:hypothetical protein
MDVNVQRRLRFGVGLLLLLTLFSLAAWAQRTTGTLKGQVTDPSGALIAGARVSATNQETGVVTTTQTTSAGTYIFPSVLPGMYTVSAEQKNFKTSVLKDVRVQANQENPADLSMSMGEARELVEVVAGAEAVQTTSSTLASNYDNKSITELPNAGGTLNGSPLNLAVLSANTTAQPGGVVGVGGSVGGTRPRDNNFVVDGVDDNNQNVTGNNSTVIPDAVAEFNLITNQFSAEYGHSAGGQFILVTKSGTNNWHGDGHGYFQNRNFNALDNLTKSAIQSKSLDHVPRFDNNRMGTTIGGPLMKNRWFIFGAYEYTDFHAEGNTVGVPVTPTAAGLATLESLAVNPTVANRLKFFPTAAANDAGTVCVNGTGTSCTGGSLIPLGSTVLISPNFQREHDFIINSDYNLGRHAIGFRYLFNNISSIFAVQTPDPRFNQDLTVKNRKATVTDAWTINNHMVNELRLSYAKYAQNYANPAGANGTPDITINNLARLQTGPTDDQFNKQDSYQLVDNLTYTRGKHTFKQGFEYRHYISPSFFLSRSNGDYVYNSLTEFINDQVPGNSGQTLRNAGNGNFAGTQSAFYGFVQDDFKVTPRLTLNLGVRYEYWTNPSGSNQQALNALADVPGVVQFRKPKTDTNNIAPRFGFAWDPTGAGKWSVRGGFGIAYDVKFLNFASISLPPELQSELNEASSCTLSPQPSWCTTRTGFLAGGGLPAVYVPNTDPAHNRALTTGYIDDTVMPKVLNWTLGVQHEIYPGATVEVRYLGTRSLSLPVQYRMNRQSAFDAGITPLPTFFKASDVPASVTPGLVGVNTDTAFNNFDSNKWAQYGFTANVTGDPPKGGGIYHSGSVTFTQRARYGLTLNTNYTYSHNIDDSTNEFFTSLLNPRRAQDTNRIADDRGNSDLDVRQKFSLSLIYDVPKAHVESGWMKAVLNGYQLNTAYVAQTGQPITILSGIDSNGNGDAAGDRVVLNPNAHGLGGSDAFSVCAVPATGAVFLSPDTLFNGSNGGVCTDPTNNKVIDPAIGDLAQDPNARYVIAGYGVRANSGRNSFRSPGFGILNFSVFKNTHITESKYFQIRAEAFNVFNHRNFTISNGNIFNTAGVATATGNPGYAQAAAGPAAFLNAQAFNGGSRTMVLGVKFVF